ncbi:MAG: flavin reductase family protein, partial [Methylobacteriaceae bacterium]|nr:flavin reductase family protein [Methylobacteriaceae bacterium]
FSGRTGVRGAARFAGAEWTSLATGAPLLADALTAIDCSFEGSLDWHSHTIVIGRVEAVRVRGGGSPLLYWQGDYDGLGSARKPLDLTALVAPEAVARLLCQPAHVW